jgi:hypothetical protein
VKNYRLIILCAVLVPFVAFYGCNKHKDDVIPSGDLPEDKVVTASVQGRVLDEDGLPVQGAAVTSGTASTVTDENGVFSFSDISMSSRFGFVKVTKQGYFTGSRSILTTASSSNFVSITLIPRTSKGTFSASGGGTVAIQTGDTVSFDASSVVNAATNAAYTGTVHVYAYYLDPLATDAAAHMPGDLRGVGKDGKETLLQSFGMMVVELEGDGGEKLQIAPGKQASITMKIPDALKATAAATIPLWYFNDTTGRWIEQGTAIRKGDTYCGQTSHFSWWNCDAPTATVKLKMQIKDQHGIALSFIQVLLTSPTFGTASGYTDAAGYVSGLIPQGQTLQMKVVSFCGTLLAGANIGPALTDQDLGIVTVNMEVGSLTLMGTVINCSGSKVDSGYAAVVVDGLNYRGAVTNGAFAINVTRCNTSTTTAKLFVGDYKTLQQGSSVSLSVDTGKADAGQLTACGTSVEQYIKVSVNGKDYNVTAPPDSVTYGMSGNSYIFWGSPILNNSTPEIGFSVLDLSGTGSYPTQYLYVKTPGLYLFQTGQGQCTVTQYGNINEFLQGNLSGTVRDSVAQATYPMTGSFRVKRWN